MTHFNSTILEFSLVVATKEQVSSELAEEVVILNLKSGTYYGLNPVGARIWTLIQEPKTVHEIQSAILEEYEIDVDTCDRDIKALLEELATSGLIEVKNEAAI